MPFHDTLLAPAGQWTLATNSDVAAARIQNGDGPVIKVQATVGAVAPTNALGSITLERRTILSSDMTIATLFPGVPGANRLWVFSLEDTNFSVSHA